MSVKPKFTQNPIFPETLSRSFRFFGRYKTKMADYLPLPDSETADTRPARVASLDVFRGLCVFVISLSLFDFSFASLFLVVEQCVCLCFCFCCFLKQSKIVHLCFALNANSQWHFCRLSFCLVTQKM